MEAAGEREREGGERRQQAAAREREADGERNDRQRERGTRVRREKERGGKSGVELEIEEEDRGVFLVGTLIGLLRCGLHCRGEYPQLVRAL